MSQFDWSIKKNMLLWRLFNIEGSTLKYVAPPLWSTYIHEIRTTFAKAYGIEVRCYWEHIENLRNMLGTWWESIGNLWERTENTLVHSTNSWWANPSDPRTNWAVLNRSTPLASIPQYKSTLMLPFGSPFTNYKHESWTMAKEYGMKLKCYWDVDDQLRLWNLQPWVRAILKAHWVSTGRNITCKMWCHAISIFLGLLKLVDDMWGDERAGQQSWS